MMKKKKQNLNYPLIAIVVFALIVVVYLITRPNVKQGIPYPTPSYAPTQTTKERIYQSKTLKFSIRVPSGFQVEERFTTASIKNIAGEILLSRVATDFENIGDYLNDLSVKNRIKITNRENIKISNLDCIRGEVYYASTSNPTKYAYFIYADRWVYSVSTSLPALFDALDQIAQSFRYTP